MDPAACGIPELELGRKQKRCEVWGQGREEMGLNAQVLRRGQHGGVGSLRSFSSQSKGTSSSFRTALVCSLRPGGTAPLQASWVLVLAPRVALSWSQGELWLPGLLTPGLHGPWASSGCPQAQALLLVTRFAAFPGCTSHLQRPGASFMVVNQASRSFQRGPSPALCYSE